MLLELGFLFADQVELLGVLRIKDGKGVGYRASFQGFQVP